MKNLREIKLVQKWISAVALTMLVSACGGSFQEEKKIDLNSIDFSAAVSGLISEEAPAGVCISDITITGNCDTRIKDLKIQIGEQAAIACPESGIFKGSISLSSSLKEVMIHWSSADGQSAQKSFSLSSQYARLAGIAVGEKNSCVVTNVGHLKCWGGNSQGQLGLGFEEDDAPAINPAFTLIGDEPEDMGANLDSVNLKSDLAISVTVGGKHICALLSSGDIKCWGDNTCGAGGYNDDYYSKEGKIGDKGYKPGDQQEMNGLPYVELGYESRTPTKIKNKAIQIDAGGEHTCAVLKSGRLKCWGQNGYGQIGQNADIDEVGHGPLEMLGAPPLEAEALKPVIFGGAYALKKVVQVSAGGIWSANRVTTCVSTESQEGHTCAIFEDGSLICFGSNFSGQSGIPRTVARTIGRASERGTDQTNISIAGLLPLNFGGLKVLQVAAGGKHTCALLENGKVRCFGSNKYGQLGVGDMTDRDDASRVANVNLGKDENGKDYTAIQVSAGIDHSCAVLNDHKVKCWGRNNSGQLGQGSIVDIGSSSSDIANLVPIDLGKDLTVKELSAGGFHTCVILNNKAVKCFGSNGDAQLGLGENALYRGGTSADMGDNLYAVAIGSELPRTFCGE